MLAKRPDPCLAIEPGTACSTAAFARNLANLARGLEADGVDDTDRHPAASESDTGAARAISDDVQVTVLAGGMFSAQEHIRGALLEERADGLLLPLDAIQVARGMAEEKQYLAAAGIVVRGVS